MASFREEGMRRLKMNPVVSMNNVKNGIRFPFRTEQELFSEMIVCKKEPAILIGYNEVKLVMAPQGRDPFIYPRILNGWKFLFLGL
jgi:hypothetical protein